MKGFIICTVCLVLACFDLGCQSSVEAPAGGSESHVAATSQEPTPAAIPASSPAIPNLQAELLDDRNKTTDSPIGKFDFKNFSYPLPRGWENPDGSEITLVNGRRDPVIIDTNVDSTDDEKLEAKADRRIGMSFVTTKFLDVNNDGEDEALVVLKIETAGSAIPQIVYVYSWKDGQPQLFWSFRTGDRTDGGLKDMRVADGTLVVELYGQDRFLLGQSETGKITGDYEQLCCPVYFTRSFYKWNGKSFLMQGKRLTLKVADPSAPPVENMGDIVNAKTKTAARK
ncbi:MAG: hypothetical protein ABJA02_06075 [Acidobacteriota bacterium]